MRDLDDKLWKAADKLRGQVDAAAYKHVVLALLFLRFVGVGRGRIACPPAACWERLGPGRIDAALRAVERANPELKGALPQGLDGLTRIDELLALFADVTFAGADDLGRVYEYFLGRFARAEGRRGGQFYTPRSLVLLLRRLLHPLDGSVYDPCCGSGGMFVHGGAVRGAFGQESNPGTWRLARQNLALHGAVADLGPRPADTFREDLHAGRLADFVLANPPFNQSDWGSRDRWPYGTPPSGNANFAWIQHVLAHLKPGGRAAVVLANGSLGAGKAEGAIRRALVEAGHVEGIVALPPQLFLSTAIPACVWVLSQAPVGRTVFVDARAMGTLVDRSLRELSVTDIERITAADPAISAVADRAAIARNGFVLFPGRYVAPRAAEGAEPPHARWKRLAAEWAALAEESERLGREIRLEG